MVKGDGSVTEVKRGIFRVRLDLGIDPVTKKRKVISRNVRGTKKEAAKVRDELKAEIEAERERERKRELDRRNGIEPVEEKPPLPIGEYLTQWVASRKASNDLTHATISNYERYIRVWIAPYLGSLDIVELKPLHVKTWHTKAREDGASPRTLQAAHKVLKQALRDAVFDELMPSNPCDAVRTPKAESKSRGYLVPDEARRMLKVLDETRETGFTIAVRLGLATGARRGEVLGLIWKNVDLENATISITQSLAQVDGAKKEGTAAKEIKAPKTEKGKRRISLDGATVKHLREWKRLQAMELYKSGIRQKQSTPVCASLYDAKIGGIAPFVGGFLDPQSFSKQFAEFCDKHGFKSTTGKRLCFHELRHTQATLLLSSGEDIVNVAGRLGHSSPSVTSDMYAHAMPEKDRECAEVMGRIFAEPEKAAILQVKTA